MAGVPERDKATPVKLQAYYRGATSGKQLEVISLIAGWEMAEWRLRLGETAARDRYPTRNAGTAAADRWKYLEILVDAALDRGDEKFASSLAAIGALTTEVDWAGLPSNAVALVRDRLYGGLRTPLSGPAAIFMYFVHRLVTDAAPTVPDLLGRVQASETTNANRPFRLAVAFAERFRRLGSEFHAAVAALPAASPSGTKTGMYALLVERTPLEDDTWKKIQTLFGSIPEGGLEQMLILGGVTCLENRQLPPMLSGKTLDELTRSHVFRKAFEYVGNRTGFALERVKLAQHLLAVLSPSDTTQHYELLESLTEAPAQVTPLQRAMTLVWARMNVSVADQRELIKFLRDGDERRALPTSKQQLAAEALAVLLTRAEITTDFEILYNLVHFLSGVNDQFTGTTQEAAAQRAALSRNVILAIGGYRGRTGLRHGEHALPRTTDIGESDVMTTLPPIVAEDADVLPPGTQWAAAFAFHLFSGRTNDLITRLLRQVPDILAKPDAPLSRTTSAATVVAAPVPATPTPVREETPTPVREETPTPVREETPTPVREETPTPVPPVAVVAATAGGVFAYLEEMALETTPIARRLLRASQVVRVAGVRPLTVRELRPVADTLSSVLIKGNRITLEERELARLCGVLFALSTRAFAGLNALARDTRIIVASIERGATSGDPALKELCLKLEELAIDTSRYREVIDAFNALAVSRDSHGANRATALQSMTDRFGDADAAMGTRLALGSQLLRIAGQTPLTIEQLHPVVAALQANGRETDPEKRELARLAILIVIRSVPTLRASYAFASQVALEIAGRLLYAQQSTDPAVSAGALAIPALVAETEQVEAVRSVLRGICAREIEQSGAAAGGGQ